jgi:hypothetical protein
VATYTSAALPSGGYALLNLQLNGEIDNLRRLLAETAIKWNN